MKQSKEVYCINNFESNWNNIENAWKGIKTIISIKNITATVPHSIEFNNKTITDPTAMSNVFNNYFTSTAKKKTLISNFHQNITQTTYLIQTQIPFS